MTVRPRFRRTQVLVGCLACGLAVVLIFILVGGPTRVSFWIQSELYGNVPSYAGCDQSPSVQEAEAALAAENPFKINDRIYQVAAGPLDECPDRAHIWIEFAGDSDRRLLEAYLAEHGSWEPGTGWWWHGVPVSLTNV